MARPKKEVTEENIERFQRELELAGDRIDILLHDKKGRSRSCLLCRRRKQRCDHKLPSCTACLKAAVRCVQPVGYSKAKSSSTNNLTTISSNRSDSIPSTPVESQDSRMNTPVDLSSAVAPIPPSPISSAAILERKNNDKPTFEIDKSLANTSSKVQKDSTKKDDYTSFLERKLKYLEKLIDIPPTSNAYNKRLIQYKKISHLLGEVGNLTNLNIDQNGSSTTQAQSLMSSAFSNSQLSFKTNPSNASSPSAHSPSILPPPPNQNQPKFTPIIKAFSQNLVNSYQRAIQDEQEPSNIINSSIPSLATDSFDSIDFSKCIFSKYNLKEFFAYDPAFDFDEQLSRSFLDIFFTRLQFKYPLLDEQEIYDFHDRYINNNIHSFSENEFHFSCGRIWLVFSISACLNMTTGKYRGLPPVRYFSTAIRHVTRCGANLTDAQKVELLTLLVLYIIRTDRDSMVLYEIIKDVMDISKNNLKLNKLYPDDPFAKKKLRLFWCVYLLQRMICVAVGRPYTIAEAEIDLPLFSEGSFNTSIVTDRPGQSHGVHFINQSLRLRRLESQFVEKLGIIPQRSISKDILREHLPLVKLYFHDLELWRADCSRDDVRNFENETLKLYYYRSVRLLIQPYLEILTPEDRLFRECQAAAGQICQLYKIFHQKTVNGHSTPAVHTVFVAGVTLIYCMWLARNLDDDRRRKLGDESKHTRPLVSASLFSTMDDLRACSVSLYVMTERSNFARTFRDTFDQLMNATIGNLIERCGPDSSELIYITSGNVDVILANDENGQTKRIMNVDENPAYEEKRTTIDNEKLKGENLSSFKQNNRSKQNSSDNYSTGNEGLKKIRSGMPPAINRRFGRRLTDGHIGFGEGTLVDLEEQKEMKKKQIVLEKHAIPKSLSHLLDAPPSKGDDECDNKISTLDQSGLGDDQQIQMELQMRMQMGDSNSSGRNSMVSINEQNTNQYIVKKHVNSNEFDWQSKFEQQAFLQQKFAQENLKFYLSSLNHQPNATNIKQENGIYHPQTIPNHPISMLGNPSSSMNQQQPHPHQQQQQPHYPILSMANASSISGSVVSNAPSPHNTNNFNNVNIPFNSQTQASVPSITIPPANHEDTINSGDILFSSGTHDMINNISTWTNDSVVNIINNIQVPTTSTAPARAATPVQEHQQVHRGIHNFNIKQFETQNEQVGAKEDSSNNTFMPLQESFDTADGSRKMPMQFPMNASWDSSTLAPVEEFWTVNDDYGFLT